MKLPERFADDLPICPVIHLGRTGSTYFERVLARAWSSISIGEVMNREVTSPHLADHLGFFRRYFNGNIESYLGYCISRATEQEYWRQYHSETGEITKRGPIILEYKPTLLENAFHPVHGQFLCAVKKLDAPLVVVLRRRSVLRRVLSSQIARMTDVWHSDQVDDEYRNPMVEVDVQEVIDDGIDAGTAVTLVEAQARDDLYFRKLELELLALGLPYRFVTYEDEICGDIEGLVGELSTTFGVTPRFDPDVGIRKLGRESLAEVISNYTEVLEYCLTNAIRLG